MSGMAGVFHFGAVHRDPHRIEKLTEAMSHRGPDGRNHWSDDRIDLGHCLLRVTPQSRNEIQPFHDEKSGLVLVFDGRLDNRNEVAARLEMGADRMGVPDTELIIEAFRRWGGDCPRYFRGDFAFAIWNPKRHSLFCARDPVGGASFYYAQTKDCFAFASKSEALVGLPGVSHAPNDEQIAGMLVPAFSNGGDRRDWLRDVEALLPGEVLTVSADRSIRIRKYGGFNASEPRSYDSYEECEAHFLSVFGEAVADRMQVNADPAIMLSGGIDSAAIVAMTRRLLPELAENTVHSYSVVDDDWEECIESRAILSMSRAFGTNAHRLAVPSFSGPLKKQTLLETAWKNAHPVSNSILLPALMYQAAAEDGHAMMMHGLCGDLTTNAPVYYPAHWLRRRRILKAWRECNDAANNHYYLRGHRPSTIFFRSTWHAFAPRALKNGVQQWRLRHERSLFEGSLINEEFATALSLAERIRDERSAEQRIRKQNAQQHHVENTVRLICSALSASNLVAGQYGMESRDPWSDVRVLDCFLRMPVVFKVQQGWSKFPVRSAFENDLEPFVLRRKDKLHLGHKVILKLLTESQTLLSELIAQEMTEIEKYINIRAFRSMFEQYVKEGELGHFHSIFEVFTLLFWLRRIKTL